MSAADPTPAEPFTLASNAGPWTHDDGTACPSYYASRPRPDADNYWWCTEHQQHVRPAVPDTGDVEALGVALCDADESWEHHDATDDHPCLRCKALAVRMLPYVAEVRRETGEQAWEDGVRQAVTWLRADYPYGEGPEWRENGAEWIAGRLAEHTRIARGGGAR